MTYTNVLEKLVIILKLIGNSWLSVIFILFAIVFGFMLMFKKLTKKSGFICILSACLGLLICNIYKYFEPLSVMMDSLIDNLFTYIYFPSAYSYLFVLLFINIVTIINLLNPKANKIYKRIHGICFIIINFVLAFILEMIAKYDINIFSKKSIFSNTDFVTLLEFSMNIFIVWLVSLLIVYIIDIITYKIIVIKEGRVLKKSSVNMINHEISIPNDELKDDYINDNASNVLDSDVFIPSADNKFIPAFVNLNTNYSYHYNNLNISKMDDFEIRNNVSSSLVNNVEVNNENTFDLSSFIPKKQEVKPIIEFSNQNNKNEVFEQILNNQLPFIKEEEVKVNNEKDNYTLNDYRIFNKMLKDIREHNESNSITIDKNLEYRLITKYSTETYHMFQNMLKIYSN